MPLPAIPAAPFPDVPDLPGVPALPRSNLAPVLEQIALATPAIQSLLWQSTASAPTWGIFDSDNNLVLKPDSIVDFDYRNESAVSDFPVQEGSFANYNKVNNPYEISLRLAIGRNIGERATFLAQLDKISLSLDLYTILTLERTYRNVNITRYEVTRRGGAAAFFLTEVDIYFREIRQVSAQYVNIDSSTSGASQPGDQPLDNNGTAQAQDPNLTQAALAQGILTGPQ